MDILNLQGLGSNTLCCLDAGVSDSYPGSGDTWFDLSGNGRDWSNTNPSGADMGTFFGTADARTSGEGFSDPDDRLKGLVGGIAAPEGGSNFSFMDNWHTTSANFTAIVGFKLPANFNTTYNILQTGGWFWQGACTKGFAIHRVGDNGNGGITTKNTPKRLYLLNNGQDRTSGSAVRAVDSTLTIPSDQFIFLIVSVTSSIQRFRVNSNSAAINSSYGEGNTNPLTFGVLEYPRRAAMLQFDGGTIAGRSLSMMAMLDTAISATAMQNLYNAFKLYRDPSLP